MAISIPDRVVVFDYGEVISRSPSATSQAELVALAGVDEASFRAAYDRHRHALDQGRLSVVEYWRAIERETGANWSLARVHELWARDFTSWFDPEPAVLDLLAELHDGGTRLALLSNAGFDFGDPFRFSPLGSLMETVIVSAELDLIKPDPEIYRRAMAELGTDPTGTAFIDNRADNVEAAAALGIATHHFTGVAGLRAFLQGLAS
ncbi:HAD family hydrolase [Pseudolysinimonas sp.]|uniref:HAD family hydrolase n=1 Tax=Pseudolysinimonas sp. TaxID=2680009 RepID=UPI003F7E8E98